MRFVNAGGLIAFILLVIVLLVYVLFSFSQEREIQRLRQRLHQAAFRLPQGYGYWWVDTPKGPMAFQVVENGYGQIMELLFYFPEGMGFPQEIAERLSANSDGNYVLVPTRGHEADARLAWETLTIGMTIGGPKTLEDAKFDLLQMLPEAFEAPIHHS